MNRRLWALIVVLATIGIAGPASAGGIIVVLKTSDEASSSSPGVPDESMAGIDDGQFAPDSSQGSSLDLGPAGSTPGIQLASVSDSGVGVFVLPLDSGMDGVPQNDASYGIEMGEDEFAEMGCGGAQAAGGSAGFIPFAVAGLALLFRRRKS